MRHPFRLKPLLPFAAAAFLLSAQWSAAAGKAEKKEQTWYGTAGFRAGASTLLPTRSGGFSGGLRGSLLFRSGLEVAASVDRSEYSNDFRYLGVRAEGLFNFKIGERMIGFGVTGGTGRYSLHRGETMINGNAFWSVGAIGRVEILPLRSNLRFGADVLTLAKRPGDRTLAALSPGIWIQARL